MSKSEKPNWVEVGTLVIAALAMIGGLVQFFSFGHVLKQVEKNLKKEEMAFKSQGVLQIAGTLRSESSKDQPTENAKPLPRDRFASVVLDVTNIRRAPVVIAKVELEVTAVSIDPASRIGRKIQSLRMLTGETAQHVQYTTTVTKMDQRQETRVRQVRVPTDNESLDSRREPRPEEQSRRPAPKSVQLPAAPPVPTETTTKTGTTTANEKQGTPVDPTTENHPTSDRATVGRAKKGVQGGPEALTEPETITRSVTVGIPNPSRVSLLSISKEGQLIADTLAHDGSSKSVVQTYDPKSRSGGKILAGQTRSVSFRLFLEEGDTPVLFSVTANCWLAHAKKPYKWQTWLSLGGLPPIRRDAEEKPVDDTRLPR